MTIYGATGGVVTGQPISPHFGAQNGASQPGGPITQLPSGMPMFEACSRGLVPINALINSINGVGVGVGNAPATVGFNPVTVSETLSSGTGPNTPTGASSAPNGANDQQGFVEGIASVVATEANGPTAVDTSSLTQSPVSGATLLQNVVLVAQGFGG